MTEPPAEPQPPFWNLWARYRFWSKANPGQAQIAYIMAGALGMIALMFLITIAIIIRLLM
jgi:hypothetical protein